MAKAEDTILVVHVSYPNAELVPKIEARLERYGAVVAELRLRAPDKNGRWITRSASYIILTEDVRALKISLTQIQNHENLLISF